jgi:cell division septation protein DedD
MKWIIYALLLANLGFGLWHYRSEALSGATPNSSENDNLRLVTVKEFLAQQQQPPTLHTAQAETGASCYTLGPFKKMDDANAVRGQLKAAGVVAKRRMSKDTARTGFWVVLPPAASHAQARQSINALKAKGVTDYFLVATGDMTNAVSLGVFAQSDTAKRRYDEIKAMGFNPKLRNVDLPLREYWLDWPVEQSVPPAVLGKINKEYSGIGQTTRSCNGS